MAGIGSLQVSLGLDAAEFTRGLTKAQVDAQKSLEGIKAAAFQVGTAIGAALSVHAFKDLIQGAIDSADELAKLSQKTGIAVETLGGIGHAADLAGVDLQTASVATGKLNKALSEAAAGNVQAAEAFKVLGVNVKDAAGNTIGADKALASIADKFAAAADGPEKVAIAMRIFGKAGADLIPLLDAGGEELRKNIEYFNRYAGVSTETAKQAEKFNDTLTKIDLLSKAFGQTLAAELLPYLQRLADMWLEAKEKGDQFRGLAETIVTVLKGAGLAAAFAAEQFLAYARSLAVAAVTSERLAHLDLSGARAAIAAFGEDNEAARKRVVALYDTLFANEAKAKASSRSIRTAADFQRGEKEGSDFSGAPKRRLGRLGDSGSAGPKDDPTKRLLDNQLKAIEEGVNRERDLLQSRNRFLDLFNGEGLLSVKAYYDGRKVAQDQAVAAEVAGYNREIAAVEAYKGQKGRTQKEIAESEGKIADIVAKRERVERQAGESSIEMAIRQAQAQEDLRKAFQGVTAQVLDLQEQFGKADAIRFDQQYDALKKVFSVEGNQAGLDAIATLRAAAIAQGQYQKAALDTSRTLDGLGRQEEYLALAQQTGATTSLDALVKLGEIRRAQIPVLEAQVQAQEAIARASEQQTLITNADNARLALERLKAAADPLGDKLNDIFQNSATNAIYDFITGTKSAAEAFKSFASTVIAELTRIAAKQLAEQAFSKQNGGGYLGIIQSIAGLFGGGGGNTYAGVPSGTPLAVGTDYVPYDGFKATLHKGEAVVPAAFNPANRPQGGGPRVVIENHGADIQQKSETGPSGEETIRFIIRTATEQAKAGVIGDIRSGGATHDALRSTYGLNRAAGAAKRG